MIDFDLDGDNSPTADKIDNFQKTGGIMPDGKYHAVLDGWKPAQANSGLTGEELTYKVISGPHAGTEVKDTLWNSDKEGAKNRAVLFAHKLGLLVRNGAKFKLADGKTSFADCLGAEVVIETKKEDYVTTKGKKGTAVRVTFNGIFSVDDPTVKSVISAKAKPAANVKEAEAAKKKFDSSAL